jgi:hypothetical protein
MRVIVITVVLAGLLAGCGSSTGSELGAGRGGSSGGLHVTVGENTRAKLTEIAQRQAQALGDPNVHSAEVVLTTRRRMNSGLGIGYQASRDQGAKVFVIQVVGTFTCDMCSHPPEVAAPTGSAAQDVLSYRSLRGTDFGLTKTPVVMQRMGPVLRLTWEAENIPAKRLAAIDRR